MAVRDVHAPDRERPKPLSSRLDPSDASAIAVARTMRTDAISLRTSIERGSTVFESEFDDFRSIVKRAPSALQESAAALQDLAGVGSRYFSEVERYGQQRKRDHMLRVLDAIVDTADERLRDIEGHLVSRWVDTPYELDAARDLQNALTEIVRYLAASNSLSQVPELDGASRRHLIDLCETIITLLNGRKVELSLLSQCARALKQLAPVVVSAAVSAAVTVAVTHLVQPLEQSCGSRHYDDDKAAA